MVCCEVNGLYDRYNRASKLMRKTSNKEEIMALQNYLANIDLSINDVIGEDYNNEEYLLFGGKIKYKIFKNRLKKYNIEMLKSFISDKGFHQDYIGDILFGVEQLLQDDFIFFDDLEYTILQKNDYYELLFDFMKSIEQDKLVDDFLHKGKIYSIIGDRDLACLGSTIYNPINKDIDVFVRDFHYDIHSMFTIVHEFGHVFDLVNFNQSISDYNKYFYQSFNGEVISKLFERLFIEYLLERDMLGDELRDKMFEVEITNHDYLLKAYFLSLIPDNYLKNERYVNISKKGIYDLIEDYFDKKEVVFEFIKNSTYFDISEDYSYAYGNIISMFLDKRIQDEGFSNELLQEFMRTRSEVFNTKLIERWEMTPEIYLKLYKEKIQVLKK